ncbi:rhomboid family intramembrane serine protease, partial [Planctomycetota bacterium]
MGILVSMAVLRGTAPGSEGPVGFGAFAILVLLPGALLRLTTRLAVQGRNVIALRLSQLMRLLHPFDGWWRRPAFHEAHLLVARGEIDRAVAIYERLRDDHTPMGRFSTLNLLRIRGSWAELRAWIESTGFEAADPHTLGFYLRALGETGELRALVAAARNLLPRMDRFGGTAADQGRMVLLAFTGRREALETLLTGRLRDLPAFSHAFWFATADLAQGRIEEARAALQELLAQAPAGTLRAACEHRLAHPLPIAAEILEAEEEGVIADAVDKVRQTERYAPLARQSLGRARLTYLLAAVVLVAFVVAERRGGSTDLRTLIGLGALTTDGTLPPVSTWWRLVTATFLHFGWVHLALNTAALLLFGPFV